MKISKKIKKAMDEAEKKVRKEALKPKKKKRKVVKKEDTEQRSPSSRWVEDEWGTQGEVFFDGYRYWGTLLEPSGIPGTFNVVSRFWSTEKWEERKKKRGNSTPNLGTVETEKPLSSTPKITNSTKNSKAVPKKKSSTKSGKTVFPIKQRK